MGPDEAESLDLLVCPSVPYPVAQKCSDISFFFFLYPPLTLVLHVRIRYKFFTLYKVQHDLQQETLTAAFHYG